MTADLFQTLLKSLVGLSVLLLIGTILRAKVPLFQRLLLPASVIGGFVGLLLGPNVLGEYALFRFPKEWLQIYAQIPGILIVPIFAAVPLGMYMGKKSVGTGWKKKTPTVLLMFALFWMGYMLQNVIGFGINFLFTELGIGGDLYRTFGFEMSQGFAGGHGTAGGVGALFQEFGIGNYEIAQGVAVTFATIGLIGGMLLGIFFINRASRRGETKVLSKPQNLPKTVLQGYNKNIKEQNSIGRETTISSSIDPLTLHIGLILVACGLAYAFRFYVGEIIPAITKIPPWFYALLMMYLVNFVLIKLKLQWLVDTKVKARVTGSLSDIAIVAAIASINTTAIFQYAMPILVMSVVGFLGTYFVTFPLYKFVFKEDYWFERAIISWGTNTGVMINGMMLLKVSDPEYTSPALTDFSMGFSVMSIMNIGFLAIAYPMLAEGSTLANFGLHLIIFVLLVIVVLVNYRIRSITK